MDEYAFKITRVVLFGSMLTDTSRPSDVDLALEVSPRYGRGSERQEQVEERRIALRSSQMESDFPNFLARIYWPHDEVVRYVRGGARSLSIHDVREIEGMDPVPPHRTLYVA